MSHPESSSEPHILSRREKEVLCLLARGLIDKEVAVELGISLGTVRVYRKRVKAKFGTSGLVPWVLLAWRLGEIDLDAIADEIVATHPLPRHSTPRLTDDISDSLDDEDDVVENL